jgi:hypothetical protein
VVGWLVIGKSLGPIQPAHHIVCITVPLHCVDALKLEQIG